MVGYLLLNRSLKQGYALILLLSMFVSVCVSMRQVAAQEVSFTPRYDSQASRPKRVKKTPTPQVDVARAPQLYSLGRFSRLFQEMCRIFEVEQRQDRVFLVAKAAAEDEQECPSCRAFTRQVAQSCASKARVKKAPTLSPTPDGQAAAIATPSVEREAAVAEDKRLNRYPRTDLIEVLSRLSKELYQFSPGDGPVFAALRSFEVRLFAVPDLTVGEKEYYGIVLAYLYSAWAGRPGSPLENTTPSPDEVSELFGH